MEPNLINVQRYIPLNEHISLVQQGSDNGLFVEFYWKSVESKKKSIEAGRPIFEDKAYIKIIVPGDKTKSWDRPVQLIEDSGVPPDPVRWPRQWEAFKNQQKQVAEGTPLEEWAMISRSDAASFKAINIHTVEQLAAVGDHSLTVMGMRQWRDKAKAHIEKAKDGAFERKLVEQNEALQAQITALQNQLNGYKESGILAKQEASAPPAKRGRKPKVKDEQDISTANAASGG